MSDPKSFTLIELLIVIGILAILVAAVVVTLNPAQLLAQARDSKRQQDLSALNQALNTIYALDQTTSFGTSSTIYTSLPDSTTTCANWNLPSLPSGWQYHCSPTTTLQNTDGTGWIPVNFKTTGVVSLASLPIDPINASSSNLFYTYVSGGSFELNGILESSKYRSNTSLSKPNFPGVLSYGSNQALSPLYNTSGLVGYWNFDEGSGTIANDKSGNGNNGTLLNGPTWTSGKIGGGLALNNLNSYVSVPSTSSLEYSGGDFTVSVWENETEADQANVVSKPWNGGGQYNYRIFCDGNGNVGVSLSGATSWSTSWIFVEKNQWHNIVFSIVGASSTVNFYVDGVLRYTGTHSISSWVPPSGDSSVPLSLGTYYPYGSSWVGNASFTFGGLIDDVRIYNRALSASEVQALYNATK